MKQGLFKFDYIVYDGTNAQEFEDELNLVCIEEHGELIIDSEREAVLQKGDCLMRVPDWLCVIPQRDFKERFAGDIKG